MSLDIVSSVKREGGKRERETEKKREEKRGERERQQKLPLQGEMERQRSQAGGGKICTSLGRRGGVGGGWDWSLKRTVYPGDKLGQIITI